MTERSRAPTPMRSQQPTGTNGDGTTESVPLSGETQPEVVDTGRVCERLKSLTIGNDIETAMNEFNRLVLEEPDFSKQTHAWCVENVGNQLDLTSFSAAIQVRLMFLMGYLPAETFQVMFALWSLKDDWDEHRYPRKGEVLHKLSDAFFEQMAGSYDELLGALRWAVQESTELRNQGYHFSFEKTFASAAWQTNVRSMCTVHEVDGADFWDPLWMDPEVVREATDAFRRDFRGEFKEILRCENGKKQAVFDSARDSLELFHSIHSFVVTLMFGFAYADWGCARTLWLTLGCFLMSLRLPRWIETEDEKRMYVPFGFEVLPRDSLCFGHATYYLGGLFWTILAYTLFPSVFTACGLFAAHFLCTTAFHASFVHLGSIGDSAYSVDIDRLIAPPGTNIKPGVAAMRHRAGKGWRSVPLSRLWFYAFPLLLMVMPAWTMLALIPMVGRVFTLDEISMIVDPQHYRTKWVDAHIDLEIDARVDGEEEDQVAEGEFQLDSLLSHLKAFSIPVGLNDDSKNVIKQSSQQVSNALNGLESAFRNGPQAWATSLVDSLKDLPRQILGLSPGGIESANDLSIAAYIVWAYVIYIIVFESRQPYGTKFMMVHSLSAALATCLPRSSCLAMSAFGQTLLQLQNTVTRDAEGKKDTGKVVETFAKGVETMIGVDKAVPHWQRSDLRKEWLTSVGHKARAIVNIGLLIGLTYSLFTFLLKERYQRTTGLPYELRHDTAITNEYFAIQEEVRNFNVRYPITCVGSRAETSIPNILPRALALNRRVQTLREAVRRQSRRSFIECKDFAILDEFVRHCQSISWSSTPRVSPFGLHIAGPPGMGKGALVQILAINFARILGFSSTEGRPVPYDHLVYAIPEGSKHWESYRNQRIVVKDDAYAEKKEQDEFRTLICQLFAPVPFQPPMADLSLKNMVFTSDVIITTGNTLAPPMNWIRVPEAYLKRMGVVMLVVPNDDRMVEPPGDDKTIRGVHFGPDGKRRRFRNEDSLDMDNFRYGKINLDRAQGWKLENCDVSNDAIEWFADATECVTFFCNRMRNHMIQQERITGGLTVLSSHMGGQVPHIENCDWAEVMNAVTEAVPPLEHRQPNFHDMDVGVEVTEASAGPSTGSSSGVDVEGVYAESETSSENANDLLEYLDQQRSQLFDMVDYLKENHRIGKGYDKESKEIANIHKLDILRKDQAIRRWYLKVSTDFLDINLGRQPFSQFRQNYVVDEYDHLDPPHTSNERTRYSLSRQAYMIEWLVGALYSVDHIVCADEDLSDEEVDMHVNEMLESISPKEWAGAHPHLYGAIQKWALKRRSPYSWGLILARERLSDFSAENYGLLRVLGVGILALGSLALVVQGVRHFVRTADAGVEKDYHNPQGQSKTYKREYVYNPKSVSKDAGPNDVCGNTQRFDQHLQSVYGNMAYVKVQSVTGKCYSFHGVFVKDDKLLINAHSWAMVDKKDVVTARTAYRTVSFVVGDVKVLVDKYNDVAYIATGTHQAFKDITNQFPTEDESDRCQAVAVAGVPCFLETKNGPSWYVTHVTARKTAEMRTRQGVKVSFPERSSWFGWFYEGYGKSGLSGALVISDVADHPAILGIHFGSEKDCGARGRGFSIVVTRECIAAFEGETVTKDVSMEGISDVEARAQAEKLAEKYGGEPEHFDVVGKTDTHGIWPFKSAFKPMPVLFTPVDKAPAALRPNARGSPVKNAFVKRAKFQSQEYVEDPDVLEFIVNDLVEDIKPHIDEGVSCGFLNIDDAVGGVNWHGTPRVSVKRGTSGGVMFPHKSDYIRANDEDKTVPTDKFRGIVAARVDNTKRGIATQTIFGACLKDELRSGERVKNNSTRMFYPGALDQNTEFAMTFGRWEAGFARVASRVGVMFGVNPYSSEYSCYAKTHPGYHKATDVSGFDLGAPPEIVKAAMRIPALTVSEKLRIEGAKLLRDADLDVLTNGLPSLQYETHPCQHPGIWAAYALNLAEATTPWYFRVDNCVIKSKRGLPSGLMSTYLWVCLINLLMCRIALYYRARDQQISFEEAKQRAFFLIGGDDNGHTAPTLEDLGFFNVKHLQEYFGKFDLVLKDPSAKDEVMTDEYLDTWEGFRFHGREWHVRDGQVYAQLNDDSLYGAMNWYRKPQSPEEHAEEMYRNWRLEKGMCDLENDPAFHEERFAMHEWCRNYSVRTYRDWATDLIKETAQIGGRLGTPTPEREWMVSQDCGTGGEFYAPSWFGDSNASRSSSESESDLSFSKDFKVETDEEEQLVEHYAPTIPPVRFLWSSLPMSVNLAAPPTVIWNSPPSESSLPSLVTDPDANDHNADCECDRCDVYAADTESEGCPCGECRQGFTRDVGVQEVVKTAAATIARAGIDYVMGHTITNTERSENSLGATHTSVSSATLGFKSNASQGYPLAHHSPETSVSDLSQREWVVAVVEFDTESGAGSVLYDAPVHPMVAAYSESAVGMTTVWDSHLSAFCAISYAWSGGLVWKAKMVAPQLWNGAMMFSHDAESIFAAILPEDSHRMENFVRCQFNESRELALETRNTAQPPALEMTYAVVTAASAPDPDRYSGYVTLALEDRLQAPGATTQTAYVVVTVKAAPDFTLYGRSNNALYGAGMVNGPPDPGVTQDVGESPDVVSNVASSEQAHVLMTSDAISGFCSANPTMDVHMQTSAFKNYLERRFLITTIDIDPSMIGIGSMSPRFSVWNLFALATGMQERMDAFKFIRFSKMTLNVVYAVNMTQAFAAVFVFEPLCQARLSGTADLVQVFNDVYQRDLYLDVSTGGDNPNFSLDLPFIQPDGRINPHENGVLDETYDAQLVWLTPVVRSSDDTSVGHNSMYVYAQLHDVQVDYVTNTTSVTLGRTITRRMQCGRKVRGSISAARPRREIRVTRDVGEQEDAGTTIGVPAVANESVPATGLRVDYFAKAMGHVLASAEDVMSSEHFYRHYEFPNPELFGLRTQFVVSSSVHDFPDTMFQCQEAGTIDTQLTYPAWYRGMLAAYSWEKIICSFDIYALGMLSAYASPGERFACCGFQAKFMALLKNQSIGNPVLEWTSYADATDQAYNNLGITGAAVFDLREPGEKKIEIPWWQARMFVVSPPTFANRPVVPQRQAPELELLYVLGMTPYVQWDTTDVNMTVPYPNVFMRARFIGFKSHFNTKWSPRVYTDAIYNGLVSQSQTAGSRAVNEFRP